MPFRSCKSIRSLHFFSHLVLVLVRFVRFFLSYSMYICVFVSQFCFHLSLPTIFYIIDNNNNNSGNGGGRSSSNSNKSTFSIIHRYLFVCHRFECVCVCVCVCLYVKQFCSCREKLLQNVFQPQTILWHTHNTQKRPMFSSL